MLKPLEQFICDTCGDIIEKPSDGMLEWIDYDNDETNSHEVHSFRIVHHSGASRKRNGSNISCFKHVDWKGSSQDLCDYLHPDNKMARILSFLDEGIHEKTYSGCPITDMKNYVNTVRRLTIPYFEEAILYWDDAKNDGYFAEVNSVEVYELNTLKALIVRYSPKR